MLTLYEYEIYVKGFQKTRTEAREAELRRLLSQSKEKQRTRMKFRLPKIIGAWLHPKQSEKPLQDCPETA